MFPHAASVPFLHLATKALVLENTVSAPPHAASVCSTAAGTLPPAVAFTRTLMPYTTHARTHARTHSRTHALTHTPAHAHSKTSTHAQTEADRGRHRQTDTDRNRQTEGQLDRWDRTNKRTDDRCVQSIAPHASSMRAGCRTVPPPPTCPR